LISYFIKNMNMQKTEVVVNEKDYTASPIASFLHKLISRAKFQHRRPPEGDGSFARHDLCSKDTINSIK